MTMVRSKHDKDARQSALRMRADRKSLNEIALALGISKSTVFYWLKVADKQALSPSEMKERRARRDRNYRENAATRRLADRSKFDEAANASKLTRAQKCAIAETAVLFRLLLHGFKVYGSVSDGDRADWIVSTGAAFKRIQVKWMKRHDVGRPVMKVVCTEGHDRRRKYRLDEIDYVIGYDLYSDTAYVFSSDEACGQQSLSAKPEAAEAWGKLRGLTKAGMA